MKTKLLLFGIIMLSITKIDGQTSYNCCTNAILSSYSEKIYSPEPVTDHQLELILNCGIKSSSSKNMQPWKFTVIKDEPTMKEIIDNIEPGNVIIIISGIEGEDGSTPDFDCGLATQSMFISAIDLGLGARIYGGPVDHINTNRQLFQIPQGYKAVSALRIGNTDKNVDAVSAASPRKSPEEIVNFRVTE